ncbi:hypothetical protein KKF91_16470 [Myxococcota bacterium]|nr:hypothetical protein [Myxococcota bacterium]MBU1432131.1 hypothetical protein [Myxococcota bacterium]MBU1900081.1 hypothetical protein [Myxococcota bacterium]
MARSILTLLLALSLAPAARAKDQEGLPEVLLFGSAFGIYQGVALSYWLDQHDLLPKEEMFWGSALILTTTYANFAAIRYVSQEYGVNDADAALFNSSMFWMILNGSALNVGLKRDGEALLYDTLLSGYLGQGIGILLAQNANRTAGQVSLINTVGTWTGAEMSLAMGIAGIEAGSPYFTLGTLAANLGILAGVWLSERHPISRERARLLDLGGLLGGLGGPAALFMLYGPEDHEQQWYLTSVALGIPVGIGLAWRYTQGWDDPAPAPRSSPTREALILPLLGGGF